MHKVPPATEGPQAGEALGVIFVIFSFCINNYFILALFLAVLIDEFSSDDDDGEEDEAPAAAPKGLEGAAAATSVGDAKVGIPQIILIHKSDLCT
jgi:hypothetical protein